MPPTLATAKVKATSRFADAGSGVPDTAAFDPDEVAADEEVEAPVAVGLVGGEALPAPVPRVLESLFPHAATANIAAPRAPLRAARRETAAYRELLDSVMAQFLGAASVRLL